jgi:Uma2 family endonuclease
MFCSRIKGGACYNRIDKAIRGTRMKAIMSPIPPDILSWRRRTGADQWDEMWEGVLHMAPSPNREHQRFEYRLEDWLCDHWADPNGCRVFHQINVAEPGSWPRNFRIPDLVLLTPKRFHIDRNEYFDGGPEIVVEIHSPEDEAYEKLDFYAKVGVLEVWIFDRDTKRPEIYERSGDAFEPKQMESDGWLRSSVAGIEMKAAADNHLEIRVSGRPESRTRLP